jgi:hypothetical protein
MSKSNDFETALLGLVFLNTNIANVGDATGLRGSATPGNLYAALHTADPGEAGSAITSETAYTGYARKAIPRSSAGFILTGNKINLAVNQDFPPCTANPGGTLTHFSIVTTASGAGIILYSGALTPGIPMGAGVTPRLKLTTTITED